MHFNFIASDTFDLKNFEDVEKFVDAYPDFQTVYLNDENEFHLLLKLIGVVEFKEYELTVPEFSKYWEFSPSKLPEFDEKQFDHFYKDWINLTSRENNMGEYGNLIFLRSLSSEWNKLKFRLVVKEA